jgi:hypothetical protein
MNINACTRAGTGQHAVVAALRMDSASLCEVAHELFLKRGGASFMLEHVVSA